MNHASPASLTVGSKEEEQNRQFEMDSAGRVKDEVYIPHNQSTEAGIPPTIPNNPKESDSELAMSTSSKEEAKPNMMDPASFPDGGLHAWLTCVGGFCCLFVSFGWINGELLPHGYLLHDCSLP